MDPLSAEATRAQEVLQSLDEQHEVEVQSTESDRDTIASMEVSDEEEEEQEGEKDEVKEDIIKEILKVEMAEKIKENTVKEEIKEEETQEDLEEHGHEHGEEEDLEHDDVIDAKDLPPLDLDSGIGRTGMDSGIGGIAGTAKAAKTSL